LELNIYDIPVNPAVSGMDLEKNYRELVRSVATSINIPIAVKLHPFFTALANVAHNMDLSGAKGLVLFNRFYQPDFDIETREIVSHLELSYSYELLLRLHWTAILFGNVRADLAITGGVHTAVDALKAMMVGAKVAMMASCLLRNGIDYLTKLHADVSLWMEEHEYASIRQMQGSMSRVACGEPPSFERLNYMRLLSEYTLRVEK
jgi:dihydroorotate dehydrogenase (fumarate)